MSQNLSRGSDTLVKNFGIQYVQGYYLDKPKKDHPALMALGSSAEKPG